MEVAGSNPAGATNFWDQIETFYQQAEWLNEQYGRLKKLKRQARSQKQIDELKVRAEQLRREYARFVDL